MPIKFTLASSHRTTAKMTSVRKARHANRLKGNQGQPWKEQHLFSMSLIEALKNKSFQSSKLALYVPADPSITVSLTLIIKRE